MRETEAIMFNYEESYRARWLMLYDGKYES